MFDKLFDFLLSLWDSFIPVFVVTEYQQAVILRGGKFLNIKEAGVHFKIPFLDNPIVQDVVTTTIGSPAQSLVTLDRKEVTVESIVKYSIDDVKKYCLNIFDATDAIQDISQAAIKNVIMQKTLEECYNPEIDNIVTKKVRAEVKKYGIAIEQITLTTLGQIRSYRVIGEFPSLQG